MSFPHIFQSFLKRGLDRDIYDENSIIDYTIPHNRAKIIDLSSTFGYPDGNVMHQSITLSRTQRFASYCLRRLPLHTNDHSVPWNYDLDAETSGYGFKFHEMAVFSEKLAGLTRTEQLQYMVTAGVGVPLLKRMLHKPYYYIDLSMMSSAQVRPGYMNYGCYMLFNLDGTVKSILYNGITYGASTGAEASSCPYADSTEDVMGIPESVFAISMASIVSYVTIVLHAGLCHYVYAGNTSVLLTEYLNTADGSSMDSHEELEDFIKIFCFHNAEINTTARNILISPGGIVERLFAFSDAGLAYMLKLTASADADFSEWIFNNNHSNPIEDYVNRFVDHTRSFIRTMPFDDSVCQLLIKQITVSTIIHELVGSTIGIWVLHPRLSKTKVLLEEKDLNTLVESHQSYILNKSIIYLTSGISVPMLLGDNLRYCFRNSLTRLAFEQYQTNLRNIMDRKYSSHNGEPWTTSYFDMRNMETSISL